MPVTVVSIQTSKVPLKSEWVGTLDGYVNAQIQPQVSGYLVKQNYREGSVVHKGRCALPDRPAALSGCFRSGARGSSDRPRASLDRRRPSSRWLQINVKRDTPLAEQHAIAQSQLDTELQTQGAGRSVREARAGRHRLRKGERGIGES